MSERYIEDARGSLSSIPDRTTQREIGKLWNVLEGRLGGDRDKDHSLVTRADLTAALAGSSSTTLTAPTPIGQGVIGGAGSGTGGNLLPLDNVWTGKNTYTRTPALGSATMSLQSFQSGPVEAGSALLVGSGGTNASLEIARSTKLGLEVGGARGLSGMTIQHKVTGAAAGQNTLSALYAAIETQQSGGSAAAAWLWAGNNGAGVSVYGANIIAYHASNGRTAGCEVDISRKSGLGNVVAYSAVIFGDSGNALGNADSAFVAYSTGSPKRRFTSVFQAGHPDFGPLDCDIGLNLALASCEGAAICVPNARLVTLTGLNQEVCFLGDSNSHVFEVRGRAQPMLQVSPNGFSWGFNSASIRAHSGGFYYYGAAGGDVLLGLDGGSQEPIFGRGAFTGSAGGDSGNYIGIQFGGGGRYKIKLYNYA